jgi:FkbM family methyltransferase
MAEELRASILVKKLIKCLEQEGMADVPARTLVRLKEIMAIRTPLNIEGLSVSMLVNSDTEYTRAAKVKETWTIEWVRALPDGAVLYDVGANVGTVALAAAAGRNEAIQVVAIEPAFENYASLVRNIMINGMSDCVSALPVGLAGRSLVAPLRYQNLDPGGALHAFGDIIDLKPERSTVPVFSHACLSYRLDDLVAMEGLPFPTHIKIDVDGGEGEVLAGAERTLADRRLRGMQVEVVDFDGSHAQSHIIKEIVIAHGFQVVGELHHNEGFPRVTDFQFAR